MLERCFPRDRVGGVAVWVGGAEEVEGGVEGGEACSAVLRERWLALWRGAEEKGGTF